MSKVTAPKNNASSVVMSMPAARSPAAISRSTNGAPTAMVSQVAPATSTTAMPPARTLAAITRFLLTGNESSRSAVPRSSSPAVAAAAAVVAIAIRTRGIIMENISAFRNPAPVV